MQELEVYGLFDVSNREAISTITNWENIIGCRNLELRRDGVMEVEW